MIVFFFPVLVGIGVLIRLDSKGSVLFVQDRLGRGGRIFKLYKLRTMIDEPRDSRREILFHDRDVTRIGRWLRRFKLDEMPQLWNIIKGDMSVVGPRPALPRQLDKYDEQARRRLEVRPGLTGLSQINGNIRLSWPERWKWDVKYVNCLSPALDLEIILKTLKIVVIGEDRCFKKTDAGDRKERR